MLGYNRRSVPCAASRRARRAVAASVWATRTSSGIVSAMEAIQVLGKVRMSVFYPIRGALVRKLQNTQPSPPTGSLASFARHPVAQGQWIRAVSVAIGAGALAVPSHRCSDVETAGRCDVEATANRS